MSLADWNNELGRLEDKFVSWRHRATSALDAIEARVGAAQRQAIVDLLTQAHEQAGRAIDAQPAATRSPLPWEFSHGLAVLGLLHGKQALPKTALHWPTVVQNALPKTALHWPTVVQKDGTLLGCRQWELLDPRWAEALVQWLEHFEHPATFGTTPAVLTMPDDVALAIAGDWGTGAFEADAASIKLGKLMAAFAPDYTIHLGDVYYAGTGSEENNDMRDWPQGKRGSFTLNSNHEMYNGGFGYFAELAATFPLQNNTSYFALQNDHWLVIGLDSAYDSARLGLYMTGRLGSQQMQWLGTLPRNRRVIVLSHHEGCDATGNTKTELYGQVVQALGREPDYWYWGHLHNAICYRAQSGFHGRCIGHGAIPYGNASMLAGQPNVIWYETALAGDRNYPERVLNGFARIDLNGSAITEQLIGEDGSIRWRA